jgi:endonuclease YncB( thermonuclease family)
VGLAWHDKRCSDDEDLAEAETAARRERKGLWSGSSPVAPWEWWKTNAEHKARSKAE